ncbi:hypothetical protein PSOS111911_13705 [Pseudoalteromonas ostreae]
MPVIIKEGSTRRGKQLDVTVVFRFMGLNPQNCHQLGGELLAVDFSY